MQNNITTELKTIRRNTEKTITYLMIGFFLFGVALSFHFDTFKLGLLVGGLNFAFFLVARFVYAGTLISRLVASMAMAFFILQYIAQMHGMYEMHFWFFIMPIILIFYMDWRVFIPFAIIVVLHHSYFFAIFLQGDKLLFKEYFINQTNISWITFVYHIGLAVLGQLVAIWASAKLKFETESKLKSSGQVSSQLEKLKELTIEAKKISDEVILNTKHEVIDDESIEEILSAMSNDFSEAIETLINETNEIVEEAGVNGNLSVRMQLDGKSGTWSKVASSINNLLESVSKPMVGFNLIAQSLAEGDLSSRFKESGAQGDLKSLTSNFNQSMDKLVMLLSHAVESLQQLELESGEMKLSGMEMKNTTVEIVGAMTDISEGAQKQVSSIEHVSETLESVLNAAKNIESAASSVLKSVEHGLSNNRDGQRIVSNVVSDMSNIFDFANQTNESITILNERSNEISKVLSVITDISSQTNLLALNAAIEAAQAGDSGRGFAVVAEEIRKLAEGSRKSAKEIEKLIEDVKSDISNTAKTIKDMVSMVESGVISSKESADIFESMFKSSTSSYELTEKIMQQIKFQTENVSDVVSNVESVVVIAEETATGSEEVSTSASQFSDNMSNYTQKSDKLNQIAIELASRMKKFKLHN